jgi:hypothetical protein
MADIRYEEAERAKLKSGSTIAKPPFRQSQYGSARGEPIQSVHFWTLVRNEIPCSRILLWTKEQSGFAIVSKDSEFARGAAVALLKLAKTTPDPNVAAAFVERAADLKDRVEELPPRQDVFLDELRDADSAENLRE